MSKVMAARVLVKCLEKEGVTTIFGYPGATICPFYDELSRSTQIQHILVRHEANAAHSASGMARISGRVGVCCATSGPGALNLITGIATAYMDSVPIVAITGQVNTDQIGGDVFQEADVTGAAEPFVKHSYLVKDASDIPRIVGEAFYIALSGRPGPVLIDIPLDIQREGIEYYEGSNLKPSISIRGYKPSVTGKASQILLAANAIKAAKRPLICGGGGAFYGSVFGSGGEFVGRSETFKTLRELSKKCDIPVVTTMMGISVVPQGDYYYKGMIGMHGKPLANRALNECDLLILLGARMSDRAVIALKQGEEKGIIHVDVDPAEIGKTVLSTIPIVGDLHNVLEALVEQLPEIKNPKWNSFLDECEKSYNKTAVQATRKDFVSKIDPRLFIAKLNRFMPDDCIVVADVGQNQIWSANHIVNGEGGRFMTSGGMGTMGYSIPAAVGAKKAEPEREVIAICGDGSFQMQLMELATIAQHDINIKIIIMSNNRLGMVRELQDNNYNSNHSAVSLDGSPDFIKLSNAYGIESGRLNGNETDEEIESAIEALVSSKTAYLLEVCVDKNERSVI